MVMQWLQDFAANGTLPILQNDDIQRRQPLIRYRLRRALRTVRRAWKSIALVAVLLIVEIIFHVRSFDIPRPKENLDPPFYVGCQEPVLNGSARANAAMVMLARNSDAESAYESVRNVEEQFNRHFNYPWVFLNDKEWSEHFKRMVNKAIEDARGSSETSFEVIPEGVWGYPQWIDRDQARKDMDAMERKGISYAGTESYHHMCRYNSGFVHDHPALKKYKWYWRIDPDVQFTCAITYDPFIEMERNKKRYGYTIALWELGETVPSLFRKLVRYKEKNKIPTTSLWIALTDPSYLPWPIRRLIFWIRNRDPYGDLWNMCHFWSNFEIADMTFFRSPQYRDMFRYLDEDGGFYHERWGDAPVHSLGVALLLQPEEIHHFSDFGYLHKPFQYCTHAPTEAELARDILVPSFEHGERKYKENKELGCNCNCDPKYEKIPNTCFNRVRRTVM